MTGETLFISDCHLDSGRPDITQALSEFLGRRAARADCLYILGDLFEVWLGDDDPLEAQQPVVDALRSLAKRIPVYFIAGNRDFLLGSEFAGSVGLQLLDEPRVLQLDRHRVLLIHGDTLCTDDHDYQRFRALVRSPEWQAEFLARPLAERRQIAAQLRSESAGAMAQKAAEIMDVNLQAVESCFRENGVDTIIHGHTHRPAVHRYPGDLTRYVLGDWNPGPSFLCWHPDRGFDLRDPRV
ncbi:MAG: UDP-2,3-diacylglucosamine diphosphatase [Gammaproteobacteria bacterium]|jgi:UDP-2,3-diacylglucosamine hydrolase